MRTGDVAARLSVSDTTVRNWAERFSEYLSPSANPEHGAIRDFTEDDTRVLLTIKRESDRRVSTDEIRAILDAGRLVEEVPEPPEVEETVSATEHALALQRINVLQTELGRARERHERELERVLAERDRVQHERDEALTKVDGVRAELGARISDLNQQLLELGTEKGRLEGELKQMRERLEETRGRGLFGRRRS